MFRRRIFSSSILHEALIWRRHVSHQKEIQWKQQLQIRGNGISAQPLKIYQYLRIVCCFPWKSTSCFPMVHWVSIMVTTFTGVECSLVSALSSICLAAIISDYRHINTAMVGGSWGRAGTICSPSARHIATSGQHPQPGNKNGSTLGNI